MPYAHDLTRRLGLSLPVIQAPMGGGATTPALVAAACRAGALGFLGAAYLAPDAIESEVRELRSRTDRPFGINLFAPLAEAPAPGAPEAALARLRPAHRELGLPAPEVPEWPGDPFEEQFRAVLESGARAFSFTFGIPPADALSEAKARGMLVLGTATTVDEAVRLEAAGVDAVVVQGSEAGAHRGTFAADFGAASIGTMALVPQAVDAVGVPVIASGGIMDGRGIAAALALGATAVQMGTAFLTCHEAGIPDVHKAALLAAGEHETRITRAFSGRPARGIVNRAMGEIEGDAGDGAVLPYPLQNMATRAMRKAAARQGRPEFLSLWAGQGVRMARRQGAADLVARLARETDEAIRDLAARAARQPPR